MVSVGEDVIDAQIPVIEFYIVLGINFEVLRLESTFDKIESNP